MKLDLKFYNGNDTYSDGQIEDKIIELIRKYPDNYEEAFDEDDSWPVLYHLSDIRKNVIRWYPFNKNGTILEVGAGMGAITEELCKKLKKVTSIELSKKRATAILERNKNAENLEIIVGNYKDIILKDKYDYILLNGVLEYGNLYIDSENPYEDFINKLKQNLKPDGKILIAIENRFGLKYWCGAEEDHTGIPFDGINGYVQNKNIKTFSKDELENLAKSCNLNINFYYLFPDYKFTKVVYTDSSLQEDLYTEYPPYYSKKMNLVINEHNLFEEIYHNKQVSFFANSYFIELSNNKEEQIVKYAKFNNEYRNSKYNFCTYLKDDKFYKVILNENSLDKLKEIEEISKFLKEQKVNIAEIYNCDNGIYTTKIEGKNLNDILLNYYNNNDLTAIYNTFDRIYDIVKKCCVNEMKDVTTNIFNKYKIDISQEELAKMHFYEKGILDIIPSNIIVQNDEYILFDQEWQEEKLPIEYILFRTIYYSIFRTDKQIMQNLLDRYNINSSIFEKLEDEFQKNIKNKFFPILSRLCNSSDYININELQNENNALTDEVRNLRNELSSKIEEIEKLKNELNSKINENNAILNSKRYRFISYIADAKNKFIK